MKVTARCRIARQRVLSQDFVDTRSHKIVDTMSHIFVDIQDAVFCHAHLHA